MDRELKKILICQTEKGDTKNEDNSNSLNLIADCTEDQAKRQLYFKMK